MGNALHRHILSETGAGRHTRPWEGSGVGLDFEGSGRRRRLLRVRGATLIVLFGLCASCRGSDPIRLGFVAGLTGRNYDLGVSSRNGAQLAVDELNARGGVGHRPLELLVRDDAQDPALAPTLLGDLLAAGVVAVVGPSTSASAEACLPIADRERVLLVSPTASAPVFFGRDDWLVLMDTSAAPGARRIADLLARERPGARVSILYDVSNRPYADAMRRSFAEEVLRQGGRITGEVEFSSRGPVSFGALADQALAPGPDAVLIVANALDTAMLAQQLRKRAPRVQLVGSGWSVTTEVLEHGGRALEGAVFPLKVDPADPSPTAQRFRAAYQERYGRSPDYAATRSYEAVQAIAAALARDPTREGVRRELLRLRTFQGVTGEFLIDGNGDAQRPEHLCRVREGRFEQVQ